MGQYWRVFNIDKMETLGLFGVKMGEWFFTSCTTMIVQALSRDELLKERDFRVPHSGSWAGDRIICLGDYARFDDLPHGLFSLEELKELGTDSIYAKLAEAAKHKQLPDMYGDYSWAVLRNPSKKEYIHGGPSIPALWEEYDGSFPDIGTMFFSLICWSWDPSISMRVPDDVELNRGRWAGDRFDLVELADVEEELEMGGWRDVSQDVEETLARIKKADRPSLDL